MMDYAILDGKKVKTVSGILEWGAWMQANDRGVACDVFGRVRVSTVFLGLDHNLFGGRPLWFETMVFGGEHDHHQERYTTWEEAEAGHKWVVALVCRNSGGSNDS